MVSRDEAARATDAHTRPDTPAYALTTTGSFPHRRGEHLVIGIGIPRDISPEVEEAVLQLGLKGAPTIHLHGAAPIISAEQANSIVAEIKRLGGERGPCHWSKGSSPLHCGPAFLALLLGHRINATAPIQCYEWVGSGKYVPTCRFD